MNRLISKYLFYYPTVFAKGEFIPLYLEDYRKFQFFSAQRIRDYQLEKVNRLLAYVRKNNAYYQRRFAGRDISLASLDDLRSLPMLTKAELIADQAELFSSKGFFASSKTTGGSTGEPVRLFKSAGALARERAATWRGYEWAGVGIGDPQARFWGVPHSASGKVKAAITDLIANRMRLSAFDITPENLDRYYAALVKFKPAYLYGYVSVIDAFAQYLIDNRLAPIPSLKAVITTSEVLSASIRERIETAFQVKVFNEYGCGEVGSIAHECEHGRLHLMADNLIVEIDAPDDAPGEIVVTDLFNTATPLIRYRLGDFGSLDSDGCPCGRTLPVLKSVHGRAYDMIRTPAGRSIHPESLIYVFEGLQQKTRAFKQFQAIQTGLDKIVVRLVPAESMSGNLQALIIEHLKNSVSEEIEYSIEICSKLERERSGKMRLVKSNLAKIQ